MEKQNNWVYMFFDTVKSVMKLIILSKRVGVIKKTRSSGTCIILGNGPSFKQTYEKYKDQLLNIDTVCVNHFAESEMYEELKPLYYIIQAPIYFKPASEITEEYVNRRDTLFKIIGDKTAWEIKLMVPTVAKKSAVFQALLGSNKYITPIYYNDTGIEGFPTIIRTFYAKGWGIPRPHNVLIPAIMNTIKIGYDQIYITGADHSWLGELSVDENNLAMIHHKHFYDSDVSKAQAMQDNNVRPRRLHEILHKFYLSFRGYWDIQAYAEKQNVSIYNSSEYSLIDAFQRETLDKASTATRVTSNASN